MNNRLHNCTNPHQGKFKKVLCVCSAGLLRSPTTAVILASEPYNFNTRAAGLDKDHALIPVDSVLLTWADEIVCMNKEQRHILEGMVQKLGFVTKKVISLNIPDSYAYRDPELADLITKAYPYEKKEEV